MAVGIFEESENNKSTMRVMCFISLLTSILFGIITLLHAGAAANANGLYITAMFLVGAFAPKAVQKFAERKFTEK